MSLHTSGTTNMIDTVLEFPVVTQEGFSHGLRCPECGVNIREGDPYSCVLTDMTEDGEYVTELRCVYCHD